MRTKPTLIRASTEKRSSDSSRSNACSMKDLTCVTTVTACLCFPLLGQHRGIDGNVSSSQVDVTIFTMFAYNNFFDLFLNIKVNNIAAEIQPFIRNYIVHVLHSSEGFVSCMFVHDFYSIWLIFSWIQAIQDVNFILNYIMLCFLVDCR